MDRFRKRYASLHGTNKDHFINMMEEVINTLTPAKNLSHRRHVKYETMDYVKGIISVIMNSTSWRQYDGLIDGRVLNNKHNEWCKLGVYDALYEAVKEEYLESNECNSKCRSIDSSFVPNKNGTESLGRCKPYKNKRGVKVTAIVDSVGVPLFLHISPGNMNDCRIAREIIEPMDKINDSPYLLGDKGYDGEALRELIRSRGMEPIIPYRKYKGVPRKELTKKQKKILPKRVKVENFFAWMRTPSRMKQVYEKTLESFMGVLKLVASASIYKKI